MAPVHVMLILIFCAIKVIQGGGEGGEPWSYETARGTLEPKHWYLKYEQCSGKRQSPVAIKCEHIIHDTAMAPLNFVNYDKPVNDLVLYNDGHTLKIEVPEAAGLRLQSQASPNSSFRLSQFHFHWGTNDQGGSEHSINGKRWPLELHLVHVNEKIPANQTSIDKNGMVVVSVLFDLQDKKDKSIGPLDRLTQLADRVILEGESINLSAAVVGHLLPANASTNYLRYQGSLTTPPCAEVVEWVILTNTMTVSSAVLQRFRTTRQKIHDLHEDPKTKELTIQENNRPLQPLNSRPVHLMGELADLPKCKTGLIAEMTSFFDRLRSFFDQLGR